MNWKSNRLDNAKKKRKMREIKFRAWTGSKMDHNVMCGFLGAFYVQGISDNDSATMSEFNTKYDAETHVMQFTGLQDKNGKDIYEGDILKYYDHPTNSESGTGHVYFKTGAFRVTWSMIALCDYGTTWLEIIGNIHENPELLNK